MGRRKQGDFEESTEEKKARWQAEGLAHRAKTGAAFEAWKRSNPNAGEPMVERVQRALAL